MNPPPSSRPSLRCIDVNLDWGPSADSSLLSSAPLSMSQVLHHTQGTVLLDQLLMLVPFLLMGGWQVGGGGANSALLLLAAFFVVLLIVRLNYLGHLS